MIILQILSCLIGMELSFWHMKRIEPKSLGDNVQIILMAISGMGFFALAAYLAVMKL